MARNKNSDGNILLVAAGVALFPALIISFISYFSLKHRYLESVTATRVMDIKKLKMSIVIATSGVFVIILLSVGVHSIMSNFIPSMQAALTKIAFAVAIFAFLYWAYLCARHVAVQYLGIVVDKTKDLVIFPHDMQSYGLADYVSLRFLRDYCNEDHVPLSEVKRLSRGYGTDLYMHGDFGSRGIVMSNKQKRDECLTMILAAKGERGILLNELENY